MTGVDLVEAQFRIAAGESLAAIGLADQKAVGQPRGFAVQARVVATGAGTLTAYQEPSGPGVRVDACGYSGYAPPPQFDPLLAKVIGSVRLRRYVRRRPIDRTARALDEFHIAGLPTNLAQLRAILAHPDVPAPAMPARRLLAEAIEPAQARARRRSRSSTSRPARSAAAAGAARVGSGPAARPSPPGPAGGREPAWPARSSTSRSRAGDAVEAGQTLFVVSAR